MVERQSFDDYAESGEDSLAAQESPSEVQIEPVRPPLPSVREVNGDLTAHHRDEKLKDRRAVNGIVAFCVEGKPPVADDAFKRLRRNEVRILQLIAATRSVPRQGEAFDRLKQLIGEARIKTAEIEARKTVPNIQTYRSRDMYKSPSLFTKGKR